MARPKKTPENTGLMSWAEVGKRVGLTPRQAREAGNRAMEKLKAAFEDQGLDPEFLKTLAHDREVEESKHGEALAALTVNRYGKDTPVDE